MSNVIGGNFASDGISIGDRRAIALSEWLHAKGSATPDEMAAEMERLRRIMPAPEDNAIQTTAADESLFRFDAENNVQPARQVAERIAKRHGIGRDMALIDDIAHAIEDAMGIGQRRGKFL